MVASQQLLRTQLLKEFGQHPEAKWDQIQVRESRPEVVISGPPGAGGGSYPLSPPSEQKLLRDIVLPSHCELEDQPVPLERLVRFVLDLPIANSVFDTKTGRLIPKDELLSCIDLLKVRVPIIRELDDADALDSMLTLKVLFDPAKHSALPLVRLGVPRSLPALVKSRQTDNEGSALVLYPKQMRLVVQTDLLVTMQQLEPRLDYLAKTVGVEGASGIVADLTESCGRLTNALDFWATSSHLNVTAHSIKLLLEWQKGQEHEETAALAEAMQRATRDRDKEDNHIIQALWSDAQPLTKTDMTNLQKVTAMWTPDVTSEVASLVECTQKLETCARLYRTKLTASCELMSSLAKQVEENSALLDRLLAQ